MKNPNTAGKRVFPEFAPPLTPDNVAVRRSTAASREAASHRVLIARTGANGDILMGTPLLAALREAWPDAHLTWMVEPREREAIDANPHVDEMLLWDGYFWKNMTRRGLYPLWLVRALQLRRLLQEKHFDTFISFQPEDWPTLTRFIDAPTRIGVFDTFREYHRATRTSARARLYTRAFTFEELPPHRVEQYLLPLQTLNLPAPSDKRLRIGYTEADVREVDNYLAEELNQEPFVVIAPLTGWPSRHWMPDRFARVADEIAQTMGHRVIIVCSGSEKERMAIADVVGRMQTTPLLAAGRFGFRGLAALIARSALVISGDTGPMHLASALHIPYIALFGPSPHERFAPLVGEGIWLQHPVPCGPCHQLRCANEGDDHQLCLKRITVDEVLMHTRRLLHKNVHPLPVFAGQTTHV